MEQVSLVECDASLSGLDENRSRTSQPTGPLHLLHCALPD